MVSWETLLQDYNPLNDPEFAFDFFGLYSAMLGPPNDTAGYITPGNLFTTFIFFIGLQNFIAQLLIWFVIFVVPLCMIMALYWLFFMSPILKMCMTWVYDLKSKK